MKGGVSEKAVLKERSKHIKDSKDAFFFFFIVNKRSFESFMCLDLVLQLVTFFLRRCVLSSEVSPFLEMSRLSLFFQGCEFLKCNMA